MIIASLLDTDLYKYGTIDTLVGIDDEHVGAFAEAVHRAYIDTVGVFAADAVIKHDVGHCRMGAR